MDRVGVAAHRCDQIIDNIIDGLAKKYDRHVFHQDLPRKPRNKEENDDYFGEDGPLDEDPQADEMGVGSPKESSEMEEPAVSDEEKDNKLIQSAVEFLISHDKKELLDVLKEFKDEGYEDFINAVYKLEELIDVSLADDFLDDKPITTMIDNLKRKLEGFLIIKSKQHRLKMLVDDINSNRHRVQSIFTRLDDETRYIIYSEAVG